MASFRQSPWRVWVLLTTLLLVLSLPVAAVAHEHDHHGPDESSHTLEQCLFCQVTPQKVGPLPLSGLALPLAPDVGIRLTLVSGVEIPFQKHDPTVTVRGPPRT